MADTTNFMDILIASTSSEADQIRQLRIQLVQTLKLKGVEVIAVYEFPRVGSFKGVKW